MKNQKIYSFTDESGQDTKGRIFIVSVAIFEKDLKAIEQLLNSIEQASGKGKRKWKKSTKKQRLGYLQNIINSDILQGCIFFSNYAGTQSYVDLTILTTAKAILAKAREPYKALVTVDGLKKTEQKTFTAGLRSLKVKVRKVRGMRDENSVCLRLVDSIAGFVRDAIEDDKELSVMYHEFLKKKIIKQI